FLGRNNSAKTNRAVVAATPSSQEVLAAPTPRGKFGGMVHFSVSSREWPPKVLGANKRVIPRLAKRAEGPHTAQALARYDRRVLRFRRDGPLCDLIAARGPSPGSRRARDDPLFGIPEGVRGYYGRG